MSALHEASCALRYYLAGDIGGTNSRFSLFSIEHVCHLDLGHGVPGTLQFRKTYKNDDYSSFLAVLQEFMNDPQSSPTIDVACFGVAGPTTNNWALLTNRGGWEIDGAALEKATGIRTVSVINDFVAAGYGVLTLNDDEECICIQKAPKVRTAPIAVVGAGTGLGECFMTPSPTVPAGQEHPEYSCFPSEGGHVEVAPKNALETELLAYMTKLHPARVSVERIVSGAGVAALYDFFAEKYPEKLDPELHAQINADESQKSGLVSMNQQDDICRMAMTMFVDVYGQEVGNCCLKFMPMGGLYLAGGISPKNVELLSDPNGPFLHSMLAKGRVSGFLKNIPVYCVMVDDVGERGARFVAHRSLLDLICHPPKKE